MWPLRDEARTVTCIACGESVARDDAREYDKHGDRWDRDGKAFEHLCKPCFADLTRADRDGLEALLVDIGAGTRSRAEFLARYADATEDAIEDDRR